jgi:hypothetical protein
MRIWHCALIAAGVFASIATSQLPPGWSLSAEKDLTPSVIANQTSEARYLIHGELHGPEPFAGLNGVLEANVYVLARTPSSGTATIEIHSLTHPDVIPTSTTVRINNTLPNYVSTPHAWLACETDPCSDDFELVVRRDPTADLSPIDVHGQVVIMAAGSQDPMPAGTSVDITVTAEP